ncbi:hypothetical protein CCACVL1_05616, partial [Corchorus capsularis]
QRHFLTHRSELLTVGLSSSFAFPIERDTFLFPTMNHLKHRKDHPFPFLSFFSNPQLQELNPSMTRRIKL